MSDHQGRARLHTSIVKVLQHLLGEESSFSRIVFLPVRDLELFYPNRAGRWYTCYGRIKRLK